MNKKYTIINIHAFKYLFLFLLTTTHMQQSYSFFTGRIACFVAGNIYGLYAAHKQIKNQEYKAIQGTTFLSFMAAAVSNYPIIKDVIEPADFKKAAEFIKKSVQEK